MAFSNDAQRKGFFGTHNIDVTKGRRLPDINSLQNSINVMNFGHDRGYINKTKPNIIDFGDAGRDHKIYGKFDLDKKEWILEDLSEDPDFDRIVMKMNDSDIKILKSKNQKNIQDLIKVYDAIIEEKILKSDRPIYDHKEGKWLYKAFDGRKFIQNDVDVLIKIIQDDDRMSKRHDEMSRYDVGMTFRDHCLK